MRITSEFEELVMVMVMLVLAMTMTVVQGLR